ncbi:MAG: hypothetical protein WBB37_07400 [bacterium]
MVKDQPEFCSYKELLEKYKQQHRIKIGDDVLIPAVGGRKQKKKADYGQMIDVVVKQSGEHVLLFRQNNKKLLFTIYELEKCWRRYSGEIAMIRKI